MKYSIAIPAYKVEYLNRCIESVLDQDLSDFELIIVNDASPYDIDSVIEKYHDSRIKYYKNKKNCGAEHVVDNWNICLSYCSGEFVVLMGDDDEMMPGYLSTFNKLIDEFPNLNVYHCRSYIINEKSEPISITQSWPKWESVYENIWHRMNFVRSQYISDFVYKREFLLERNGFYKLPLAWASDDITSFEAAIGKGIAHTQEPLFCYRQSHTTISNSGSAELKLKAIQGEEIWYGNFIKDSEPKIELDRLFLNYIRKEYHHYFLKKKIETVAYFGFSNNNDFKDFIYWYKRRKKFNLTIQHLIYIYILFKKSKKAIIKNDNLFDKN